VSILLSAFSELIFIRLE